MVSKGIKEPAFFPRN